MPIDPQIPLGVQVPQQNPMASIAFGQELASRQAQEQERQAQAQKLQDQQARQQRIQQVMHAAVNPATGNFNTAQAVQGLRAIGAWDEADKVEKAANENVAAMSKQADEDAKARIAARQELNGQAQNMLDVSAAGRPVPPSMYQAFVTNVAKTLGPQVASSMPTKFDATFMDQAKQWGQTQDERDKHISSLTELANKKATTAKEQMAIALQALGDPTHSAADNNAILGALEHAGNVSPEIAAMLHGKDGKSVQQMRLTPDQQQSATDMKRQPAMVNGRLVDVLVDKQGNAFDAQTRQPVDARPVPSQAMINIQQGQQPQPTISAAKPDAATANVIDPRTGLTPNAVYQYAIRNAMTNEFPQMGRSSTDPQTKAARAAITGTAAAIADAAGTDLATVQQEYKMNSASLNKLGTIYNATAGAAGTANDNLDLVLGQLKNIPPEMMTNSPLVNRYSQWALGHELSGNKELTKLETYIYTAAREYGKVTSGSAGSVQGLTDAATKEAEKLISAANNQGQIEGAVEAMQNDMQNVTKNQLKQIHNVSGAVAAFLAKAHGETAPTGGGGGGVTPPPSAKVERWEVNPKTGKLEKVGG